MVYTSRKVSDEEVNTLNANASIWNQPFYCHSIQSKWTTNNWHWLSILIAYYLPYRKILSSWWCNVSSQQLTSSVYDESEHRKMGGGGVKRKLLLKITLKVLLLPSEDIPSTLGLSLVPPDGSCDNTNIGMPQHVLLCSLNGSCSFPLALGIGLPS